jgi:hypothetical protein
MDQEKAGTGRKKPMKLVNLTYAILEVNGALDTGNHDDLSVSEVTTHIQKGDIFEFLATRLGSDVDLSLLEPTIRTEITAALQDIEAAYGGRERRKWGVEHRGLCLMIAWLNELVQQRQFERCSVSTFTFDEKCDLLRSWSRILANKVENDLVMVKKALDPATELPKVAPPRAALALMEFRGIERSFDEVAGAMRMVRESIGGQSADSEPKPS